MTLHPELDDLLELRHQAHTLGLASRHLVNSTFSGLYASVFRGAGLDFDEVREYREGDDIRNMEWKVTARTDNPHIKVFREERERSVILCVDKGPHMSFGTRGTFKSIQAARAAALLGWAATNLQDRVGGLTFGSRDKGPTHFRPTRGRRALWRLLDSLTRPSDSPSMEPDPLSSALNRAERGTGTGGLIFVIADFNRNTAVLEAPLGRICQSHTLVLIPVDDPTDEDLPAMGRVVFSGPNDELIEVDTNDQSGRETYREAWHYRRDKLRSIANRLGIALIPLRTNEDVHSSLTDGLMRRARTRVYR
jgi:uncharacterized protein (DUF58 family)